MAPDEFVSFYEHWWPQMVRYFAWKNWHGQQDAEDLAQDLFTYMARHRERLRLDTAHRYMWVSARGLALTARVQQQRLPQTFDPQPTELRQRQRLRRIESSVALAAADPVASWIDYEAQHDLLADLPSRQRAAIEATLIDDVSPRQYARQLGVTVSRIYQLRNAGLSRLRFMSALDDQD